jgi:hypothetical protein
MSSKGDSPGSATLVDLNASIPEGEPGSWETKKVFSRSLDKQYFSIYFMYSIKGPVIRPDQHYLPQVLPHITVPPETLGLHDQSGNSPGFFERFGKEEIMSRPGYLDPPVVVPAKRAAWPPGAKLLLAFVAALALLSPAVLGLYWEIFLPR